MHYSISPDEIKSEIEKRGHMVTNTSSIELSLSPYFLSSRNLLQTMTFET
jgi:hypothetical protein